MNSRSRGCTAESGNLHKQVQSHCPSLPYIAHSTRTSQRLPIASGGRGGDPRVLEVAKLAASLGGLGLEVVDNRA